MTWSITWSMMFHHHPSDDPGVRPSELERLTTSVHPKAQLPIPWAEIVTSLPVWSVMLANFGSTVFYVVLIMYMPVYLKYTMKVDIAQNGFYSTLPPLGQMVVMFTAGRCASFAQAKDRMNVTTIRKVKLECPRSINHPYSLAYNPLLYTSIGTYLSIFPQIIR